MPKTFNFLSTVCSLALTLPLTVWAQGVGGQYPSKPVIVVVPFAAGSATDLEVRMYAPKFRENFGQPFVIDIKPGAGLSVAIDHTMRAPPDGHTLMVTTATYSVLPISFPDRRSDLFKVLAPVSLMTKRVGLLAVHPSVPIHSMTEYIAYAKAHPGKLTIADAGGGTAQHLALLWLSGVTGTRVTSVHYKSANLGIIDVIAGRVDGHLGTRRSLLQHTQTGKLRAIAQASLKRHPASPDLVALGEIVPDFEYPSWLGFLAPGATPLALRTRIASGLSNIVNSPDVIKLLGDEVEHVGSTPQEFERFYLREYERLKKIVEENNVQFG